jgi:hypothetical protein
VHPQPLDASAPLAVKGSTGDTGGCPPEITSATRKAFTVPLPHDSSDLPALLPVPVAAKILGLSRASAYRYAAAGELPTKRFGGRVYVITARIRPLLDGTGELVA